MSSDSVTPYILSKTHSTNVWNDKTEHTEEKNSYNWPVNNDDKLFKVTDCALTIMIPSSETLYKAVKTDVFTTLSKRRHEKIENDVSVWLTSATDDIFMTSSTEMQSMNLFSTDSTMSLLSLTETSMSQHFKKVIIDYSSKESELVKNVINTFH